MNSDGPGDELWPSGHDLDSSSSSLVTKRSISDARCTLVAAVLDDAVTEVAGGAGVLASSVLRKMELLAPLTPAVARPDFTDSLVTL